MIVNIKTALAANGVALPLQGSIYEFVSSPSLVEFGFGADATGVLVTINSGPDTVAEENPITVKTINVVPVYPDDFFSDQALPNDRLVIKLRDTSGVARTVMTQVRITPL